LFNYLGFKFVITKPFFFDAVMIPIIAYEISSPVLVYLRESHFSKFGDFEEPMQHLIIDRTMYLAQQQWNDQITDFLENKNFIFSISDYKSFDRKIIMEHNITEADLPVLLIVDYQFETTRRRPRVYFYQDEDSSACNMSAKFNNVLFDPAPITKFL
jgi:hypothetical protein